MALDTRDFIILVIVSSYFNYFWHSFQKIHAQLSVIPRIPANRNSRRHLREKRKTKEIKWMNQNLQYSPGFFLDHLRWSLGLIGPRLAQTTRPVSTRLHRGSLKYLEDSRIIWGFSMISWNLILFGLVWFSFISATETVGILKESRRESRNVYNYSCGKISMAFT